MGRQRRTVPYEYRPHRTHRTRKNQKGQFWYRKTQRRLYGMKLRLAEEIDDKLIKREPQPIMPTEKTRDPKKRLFIEDIVKRFLSEQEFAEFEKKYEDAKIRTTGKHYMTITETDVDMYRAYLRGDVTTSNAAKALGISESVLVRRFMLIGARMTKGEIKN